MGGERKLSPWPEAAEDEVHRLTVALADANREIKRLSAHDDWRRIAQGFTPGGSEYQTPAEVERFMRHFRESAHRAKVDRELARRAIRDWIEYLDVDSPGDVADEERILAAMRAALKQEG